MKLLLVNANRTAAVTAAVLAEARLAAAPGTELTAVSAAFGADIVYSHAEDAIAGHAVLDSLARHHAGVDAAVLAVSFDSGLAAARELMPFPVVGITQSALLAASTMGQAIGVITIGRVSDSLYREVFARSGLADCIAEVATIELGSTSDYLVAEKFDARVASEAAALAARGADVVVVCGAALSGIARRVQAGVPVPVVDGVACAVRQAEALMKSGYRRAQRAAGPRAQVEGVAPELAALFREL